MYTNSSAIITSCSSRSRSRHGIQDMKRKAIVGANRNTNVDYSLLMTPKRCNIQQLFKLPTPKSNNYVSLSRYPRSFRPLMEMQTCSVKMEVDVPTSVAYQCYSDREAMPKWMPFISSVKILEDKPDQSRWTLKYKAFNRDIEFSWLARNLQPIPNQKIHWRSLEGLPNSGAVRFYPRGPSSCLIELSVSYEVPQLLAPVASALQPFLESLLLRGLERFSKFAKSRQIESAN